MNKWEQFANENAEYYILTTDSVDFSTAEGQKFFFDSGAGFADESLDRVNDLLAGRDAALEIGCGIGRLTFPHAKLFNQVSGVDISPTMLNKLKARAKEKNVTNIDCFLPHEKWDEKSYDYVYSFIVFQHIPDFNIIDSYIKRISAALKKTGIGQMQFDTRPASVSYKIRNMLPDFMLPKAQQKDVRRIRRTAGEIRDVFKRHGLTIVKELASDSEGNTFIVKKQ
jgi:SAM-dependent methyltransferase